MMKRIIVEQRSADYMAFLSGRRDIWACGKNPDSAIGNLIRTHPACFDVSVTLPERAQKTT